MKPDTSNLVVLKRHNGRPSLFIELELLDETSETPSLVSKLTWLVFGYTEDFDLWLQMPLTFDEANDLVDGGPRLMDKYIGSKPGRVITLVTHGSQSESLTSFAMAVPGKADGVMWLLEAMIEHLSLRRDELERLRVQRPEVKADLRAINAVLAAV